MRTCSTILLPLSLCLLPELSAQAHWTRAYPTTSPAGRGDAAASTYDESRHCMLLFGGQTAQVNNEFWSFDGTDWTTLGTANPPPRSAAGLAFDSSRGVAVLFGGNNGNGWLNDTWEWNGTTWSQRLAPHTPPGRSNMQIAYDPARARTVLFGGFNPLLTNQFLADTWEWNGQDWLSRSSAHTPGGRLGAAMSFDPDGGVLMFGGSGPATIYDETWRWDGTDWSQLQPPMVPYARTLVAMVTDVHRRRIVLFGDASGADPYAWEWDGHTWDVRLMASPGPRSTPCMAYDTARRQVCLFGGTRGSSRLDDTWIYRTDSPADYAAFGHGCAGAAGTPSLQAAKYQLPWLGDSFTAEVHGAPANGALLLATGFDAPTPPLDLTPFGFPGCAWYVTNDVPILLFADGAGMAAWHIAVPNLPSLSGVILFQQAFVPDAAAPGGATTSNAAELTTGVR